MNSLKPMLLTSLKSYNRTQFVKDVTAGIIVAIIALPLSIALALASGVGPEAGIFTAIVAGFVISALGGSSVQIAGPTAAFATIVAGIVAKDGLDGLVISTILAGIFLILMGLCHFGSLIKFIPYTITTGFTSGIAVTIVIGQLKDFFGVTYPDGVKPIETTEKFKAFIENISTMNTAALIVGIVSLCDPDHLTGEFHLPAVNLHIIENALPNAFTIAVLAAIESLLSCVVADGMINGKHRSDMELVAQGAVISPLLYSEVSLPQERSQEPLQHQKWRTHTGCRNGALHHTGHRTRRTDAIRRNDPNADHRSNPVYRSIQYVPVAYIRTLNPHCTEK